MNLYEYLFGHLEHSGVAHDHNPPGRGSGRYAYGSGDRPNQHAWDVYSRYQKLKAAGMTEKEIAEAMGFTKEKWIKDPETGEAKKVMVGNTSVLKAEKQIATNIVKSEMYNQVMTLKETINPETGQMYTNTEIGKMLGKNESTIRSIASRGVNTNNKTFEVADTLRNAVDSKGYIDVGTGVELSLGCSPDRKKTALEVLKKEGYKVESFRVSQIGNSNQQTPFLVLMKKDGDLREVYKDKSIVKTLETMDGVDASAVLKGVAKPVEIDPKRVEIKYAEDGGTAQDGMIQIRGKYDPKTGTWEAACPDISIGSAHYAQVRIAVNGEGVEHKYIKGMATYSDELPDGVDVLVNSNKPRSKGKAGALKDQDIEKANPFGSSVIQTQYTDPKTGKKMQSAVNILGTVTPNGISDPHVEGNWATYSKNLPAQFLSKQRLTLAKQQLRVKSKQMEQELEDALKINNPEVKKKVLMDLADQFDGAAVDLKGAPIPGQGTKVILPSTTLKDTECYCPSLPHGSQVAFVRFPHAGPFEIPVCTVNNKNREGKKTIGNAIDAVMFNHNVADKLSGADFDGDTVIAMPLTKKTSSGFVKNVSIISKRSLPSLKGFDPSAAYPGVDENGKPLKGVKLMTTKQERGLQMGKISNLITDMYAKGCTDEDELARADAYSMVVIDAYKHKLDYHRAYEDYRIADLEKKYQDKGDGRHGGADSLISRSKSPRTIPIRSTRFSIDPDTGEKIYPYKVQNPTKVKREKIPIPVTPGVNDSWVDDKGKTHKSTKWAVDEHGKKLFEKDEKGRDKYRNVTDENGDPVYISRTQKVSAMSLTNDASTLLSKNPSEMELVYRDYANHSKRLANQARLDYLATGDQVYSPTAAKKYSTEVASLKKKLTTAKENAPRERQALLLATSWINAEFNAHDYDQDEKKKIRGQMQSIARETVGASKSRVRFTDKEWEAINAGAISKSMLNDLLANADSKSYMELALPKKATMTTAKINNIKSLHDAGYTNEQIASFMDCSASTVSNVLTNK